MAADPDTGHIFVAEAGNARVSEFTSWGAFVKAWGWGVADGSAELQTCGPAEPETAPDLSLCEEGLEGDGPGQFMHPLGVALDSSGNVYVVDVNFEGEKLTRVQKFSPAGEFLLMFGGEVNETTKANVCTKADLEAGDECGGGTLGTADGQFATSSVGNYIAIAPNGTIYVGDVGRIQEFEPNGIFKGEIVLADALAGKTVTQLTVDGDGNLYAVLAGENLVRKLGPTGSLLASLPVTAPGALAVDLEDNLYAITDPAAGFGTEESEPRVIAFDAGGTIIVPSDKGFARPPVTQFGSILNGLATNVLGDEGEAALSPGDLYVSAYSPQSPRAAYVTAFGPLPQFEPAPEVPPTITSQYATEVGTNSASLTAQINPHFFANTTYYVEYGTGKCSEGGCDQTAPLPLGADRDEPATAPPIPISGLQSDTTYHFRFVAISGSFTTKGLGEGEDGAEATFTTATGPGGMPDERAYELVSPTLKNNAELPGGPPGLSVAPIQASPDGAAVTYTSFTAFGPDPESSPAANQYISRRASAGGWETQNITPRDEESYLTDPIRGFSEDLAKAAVVTLEPPLTEDAPEGYENLYSMDTASEALQLVTPSTAPEIGIPRLDYCVTFQGASEDFSHIFFAANGKLTPEAEKPAGAEQVNLYEWSQETGIRLVNKLPNNAVVQPKDVAGFGAAQSCRGTPREILFRAISADGTKAVWATKTALYVRVNGTSTVQIDLKQGGPGPSGGGTFWAASDDGSKVFFTDRNKLTSAGVAITNGFGDLYRYDFSQPLGSRLVDLSASVEAKGILGVLGASEDGSAVYFASEGVLAGNEGPTGGTAQAEEPNLYRWKEGEGVRFIASLSDTSITQGGKDLFNWTDSTSDQTARVSPDGEHLAFVSSEPLTGFDNTDQSTGEPDTEVFLYDAGADDLVCASCRGSGARPIGSATLPTWSTPFEQRRYLSDDGQRLFFETKDALDVEDTNGLTDVYEFELAGKGSCDEGENTFDPASGGCIYLISTGKSTDKSSFLDASTTGDDVFFTTRQRLVPRDIDEGVDVYDAKVGGFEPPLPPEPEPCMGTNSCQGSPPALPGPQSPVTKGPTEGNLTPPKTKKCRKGTHKVKKKGKVRCVKNKKKRHHKASQNRRAAR